MRNAGPAGTKHGGARGLFARENWMDIGLLLLRLGFGLGFFFYHGLSKLLEGPERWAGLGGSMERFGIDFGHTFFGFMASFAEGVGGILIAIGFLFRPAAILLVITMFVAWYGHVVSGRGTPAHAFKNLWVALGLAFMGPGKYSVDAWLERRRRPPAMEFPAEPEA